jgi:hypothetical protein
LADGSSFADGSAGGPALPSVDGKAVVVSGSADLDLGPGGLNPERKAAVREAFALDERGQFVQIRITNRHGRITVRSTGIEARRDAVAQEGSIGE